MHLGFADISEVRSVIRGLDQNQCSARTTSDTDFIIREHPCSPGGHSLEEEQNT
jgi:hypothetical protein